MTSAISSPRKYDGWITRQELVDYCQETANKLYAELQREEAILERDSKTMSDDQFETLTFSKHSLIGHIAALREITEWAKKQVEKEREKVECNA
jgi:hypothetical protein